MIKFPNTIDPNNLPDKARVIDFSLNPECEVYLNKSVLGWLKQKSLLDEGKLQNLNLSISNDKWQITGEYFVNTGDYPPRKSREEVRLLFGNEGLVTCELVDGEIALICQ